MNSLNLIRAHVRVLHQTRAKKRVTCNTYRIPLPVVHECPVVTFWQKPNIPLSKGLGAQVSGMSIFYNSIFRYSHHDILAFSVSYMSIKIRILPWIDQVMKQFSTPYMTAAHVNIHVCIHSIQSEPNIRNLWNFHVKISSSGIFLRHRWEGMALRCFPNPHIHTNSP